MRHFLPYVMYRLFDGLAERANGHSLWWGLFRLLTEHFQAVYEHKILGRTRNYNNMTGGGWHDWLKWAQRQRRAEKEEA